MEVETEVIVFSLKKKYFFFGVVCVLIVLLFTYLKLGNCSGMDNANQSIVGLQKHNLKLDYYES
jgi:hypothetical protein